MSAAGGIQEARIINQKGDLISMQKFGSGTRKATLDISGVQPGSYIVNIYDGKKWIAKQLIIVE